MRELGLFWLLHNQPPNGAEKPPRLVNRTEKVARIFVGVPHQVSLAEKRGIMAIESAAGHGKTARAEIPFRKGGAA